MKSTRHALLAGILLLVVVLPECAAATWTAITEEALVSKDHLTFWGKEAM